MCEWEIIVGSLGCLGSYVSFGSFGSFGSSGSFCNSISFGFHLHFHAPALNPDQKLLRRATAAVAVVAVAAVVAAVAAALAVATNDHIGGQDNFLFENIVRMTPGSLRLFEL